MAALATKLTFDPRVHAQARAVAGFDRRGQRIERRRLRVQAGRARGDRAVVERLAERAHLDEDRVEAAAFRGVDLAVIALGESSAERSTHNARVSSRGAVAPTTDG